MQDTSPTRTTEETTTRPSRRVLIAVDFSPEAKKVVKWALEHVCEPNDDVLLLHALRHKVGIFCRAAGELMYEHLSTSRKKALKSYEQKQELKETLSYHQSWRMQDHDYASARRISLEVERVENDLDKLLDNFDEPEMVDVLTKHHSLKDGVKEIVRKETPEGAEREMQQYYDQVIGKGFRCELLIPRGDASTCILHAINEHRPVAVVLGSRHLGAARRTFCGSVGHHIATRAKCAVHIVDHVA